LLCPAVGADPGWSGSWTTPAGTLFGLTTGKYFVLPTPALWAHGGTDVAWQTARNQIMEPENYLDVENNPTWIGMRDMATTLNDMVKYCLAMRKANDLTLPREVRQLHLAEASHHTRLAMFCSKTGLGKTFLGRRLFRKAGLKLPAHELAPANLVNLTYELWKLVLTGCDVAPIDDADRLMRSDSMIGIMKGGWNKDDPRINCHVSERIRKNQQYRIECSDKYNPDVPPPSYPYTLATPWFANKNLATPAGLAEYTHPDFSALIARGLHPVWINSEARNVCYYALNMIEFGNLFVSINLTLPQAQETSDAFCDAAVRLGHPNPNLTLAVSLAQARKNPDYQTLWKRIISQTLQENEGQPRAITASDLKLKPDLRRAVEAGRREAERRKEAADRALAGAREAARLAEERAAARADAARKLADIEAEEAKIESAEPDKLVEPVSDDPPPTVHPPHRAKVKPVVAAPYSPPPGHVFPPPYAPVIKPSAESAPDPEPEPDPPAAAPIPDRDPELDNPPVRQTLSEIAATFTPEQIYNVYQRWELPGFRGRSGENDDLIFRLRAAFFSQDAELDSSGLRDPKLAELRKQAKSFWLQRRDRTVAEILAEFLDPLPPNPEPDPSQPDPTPEPDPDRSPPDPEPNPDPDPSPDPEPDPPVDPPESKPPSIGAAIRQIYAMKERTCAKVAEVLRHFPIQEWDEDTRQEVAETLLRAEYWTEQYELGEVYFHHDPTFKLFATATEVLQFDDDHGLQIVSWQDVATMMAPHIAEQRRKHEIGRLKEEADTIIRRSKLPKVRKLTAMLQRIDRLFEMDRLIEGQLQISDQGQKGIDYIRAMRTDDPDFAACVTFYDYLNRAIKKAKELDPKPLTAEQAEDLIHGKT
jgi:hypothetical protein